MNHKPKTTSELRKRRHARVRALVKGTAERPRLAVFRSNRFVSAQLIDDTVKAAKAKGIAAIVFDRGGYRYGGQVKTLADAAREGGLTF